MYWFLFLVLISSFQWFKVLWSLQKVWSYYHWGLAKCKITCSFNIRRIYLYFLGVFALCGTCPKQGRRVFLRVHLIMSLSVIRGLLSARAEPPIPWWHNVKTQTPQVMYEAMRLLNKQDLDGNRTKENTIYLKARTINLLMWWWRKREWDCIRGTNL